VSIPVAVEALRDTIRDFSTPPYLLTVSDDGRPHSVAVSPTWNGDLLVIPAGRRTVTNANARDLVALLWPPNDHDGYSLIVDAHVTGTGVDADGNGFVTIAPTRAVLHRPAPSANGMPATGSDCVPVLDT
jgi:hypothetical protein